MRQKSKPVFCFEWAKASDPSELKIVKAHQEKYKRISAILDESPSILDLVLTKPSTSGGGPGEVLPIRREIR